MGGPLAGLEEVALDNQRWPGARLRCGPNVNLARGQLKSLTPSISCQMQNVKGAGVLVMTTFLPSLDNVSRSGRVVVAQRWAVSRSHNYGVRPTSVVRIVALICMVHHRQKWMLADARKSMGGREGA